MCESLLEPVETDKDDDGVDEDGRADASHEADDDLLVGVEQIDVDCVETGLSCTAGGEEEGIDVWHGHCWVQHDGDDYGHAHNVRVVHGDVVEAGLPRSEACGEKTAEVFGGDNDRFEHFLGAGPMRVLAL